MFEKTPEQLLRGWAKAYRDTPEHRFPSDPHAEFFPVDMEAAADEIKRLRKALRDIAEFCSSDASKLGAINRLVSIRNTATQALRGPVGSPLTPED